MTNEVLHMFPADDPGHDASQCACQPTAMYFPETGDMKVMVHKRFGAEPAKAFPGTLKGVIQSLLAPPRPPKPNPEWKWISVDGGAIKSWAFEVEGPVTHWICDDGFAYHGSRVTVLD